jgi:peptide chain release factor 2
LNNCKKDSSSWEIVFDIGKKRETIEKLEKETQKPDFWQDSRGTRQVGTYGIDKERAIEITQKLNELREEIKVFNNLKKELEDIIKLKELGEKEEELEKEIEKFERKIKEEEFRIFLSGEYDKGSAIFSIYAGTGGQDAQDWATMLLRMYERYCALKRFQFKILHQSFGQAGGPEGRIGTKLVDVEIKGPYAYGLLKKETGVHRLVRISPFSAKQLRHTSFALVEVLPEIEKEDEIEIKPDDLKIDFYRASGPGGQYVNKRETSVRITHLPTGLVVACQSERLQGINRKKAMQVLLSKIYQLYQETKKKELSEIKGKKISASWGNQIRSYVLHPYKLVKDLRSGVKTSDVEGILDGNLDQFITAELKL